MTKFILVALLLLAPGLAHAYSEMEGAFPQGTPEIETKSVLKVAASAAIAVGDVLSYDTTVVDGYSVTKVGATTVIGNHLVACIANRAIASATVTYVPGTAIVAVVPTPCVTKGYVTAKYDSTGGVWTAGEHLCVNTVGALVNCGAIASGSSAITALETKSAGTGTDLHVLINSR